MAITDDAPTPLVALGLALALGLGLTRQRGEIEKRWLPHLTEEQAQGIVTEFSLGCIYAKLVIDIALCGLFTMQLIAYAKYVRREKPWIVGVVVVSSGLTYAISAYIIFYVHHLFVRNWGLKEPFLETNYYCFYPVIDAVASSTVQGFFTYRCWRLSGRKRWIVAVLVFLIGASLTCAAVVTGLFWGADSILNMPELRAPVVLWLVFVMLADIVITVSMMHGLLKSRTGWAHTDKIINRLIRLNLEAQVPPTIMACSFLVVFITMPESLLNFVWQGIQSKFYLIGLLYTLNSRISFEVKSVTVFNPDQDVRLGGIKVNVETQTFEERAEPLRSIQRVGGNEIVPVDTEGGVFEGYAFEGASSTSLGQPDAQGGLRERKNVSFADVYDESERRPSGGSPTSPGGATDSTLVDEVVYTQHDWDD